MTDQVSSSPEPNYPWTRYHRSQEQTTCDPDHWNLTTRSRSISPEDRDPNDDPFTRHTYIDSDANHLVENKIPIPIPPCILVKDLRITEEPPCYNWYIHGQQVGPQPAIFLLQNWLLSQENRIGNNLIKEYLYRQQRVSERLIAGYPMESEPFSQHHVTDLDSTHQAQVNNFRLNQCANRYTCLHLIEQFRQTFSYISLSAFLVTLISIFYHVIWRCCINLHSPRTQRGQLLPLGKKNDCIFTGQRPV